MFFKKIILLWLFVFSVVTVKAQLDLEHWFPPFFQSVSGTAISQIKIYLSTDKTQPFKVNIYNNNKLIDTITLSNTSPVEYTLTDDTMIRSITENRTMSVSTKGLYIAGEQSFYASLRFQDTFSEIIASKGKSALGKDFFVVNDQSILYEDPATPENAKKMNYQASFLATQDNTHIKVFNYNKNLVFCNGITDDVLNITLNKGESYTVAALKKDNKDPHPPHPVLDDNDPNFIGARITSDKPIVVNNGNFLSQDLGEPGGNINMDQTVPITKIGKEYFFANGMTVVEDAMDKAIIVATKNNTKIYFNDETTPYKTLDQGEYYIGPYPQKFISGGEETFVNAEPKQVPTKGMYIKTSEPAYVFQMIGGYNDMPRGPAIPQTPKTSGMTFSYPIDKNYIPHEKPNLIQVPFIDKIGTFKNDIKLTIKTEESANIYYNGNLLTGGSTIVGKEGWIYHTFPYQKGNINISSDKSLNIDVVGGKRMTGFASSYTGFSNDPYITKNGNCVQETVILTLSNIDFEIIQWQKNGIDIPNAHSATYIPTSSGTYRCKLTYAYGDFSYYTNEIFVDDCPYQLTDDTLEGVCAGSSFIISPQFSPPNTKYEVVKTEILTKPLNATATIVGTDINVSTDNNYSGENRIIYKITSDKGFYEIVNAKFNVYSNPNVTLTSPIDPIGTNQKNYLYNLNDATNDINTSGLTFKYFSSEADANNLKNEIKTINPYATTNKYVYVRITNTNKCFSVVSVKLNQTGTPPNPDPDPNPNPDISEFTNTFTPNDDGINDVWSFEKLKNYQNLQINIFDKFGNKVFQYKEGNPYYWDGKDLQRRKLPTGTYWAILKGENTDENKILNKSMWIYLKNR